MILADTSIWIEYLRGKEEIVEVFESYLNRREIMAVSAVFGELLQGVRNKRERKIVMLFWENLPRIDEEGLFIEAGDISQKRNLFSKGIGLIDCYLLAAAKRSDAFLWTLDKKLIQVLNLHD